MEANFSRTKWVILLFCIIEISWGREVKRLDVPFLSMKKEQHLPGLSYTTMARFHLPYAHYDNTYNKFHTIMDTVKRALLSCGYVISFLFHFHKVR